jgi:hypothetical protein
MNLLNKKLVRNQFITLVAILLLGGIVYSLFGHLIVEAMYNGKSISFLNKLIKEQPKKPLEFYLDKENNIYFALNILLVCFAFSLSFAFKVVRQQINPFYTLREELKNLSAYLSRNRRNLLISLGLFTLFYCIYLSIGFSLIPQYQRLTWFGADHTDAIPGWISRNTRSFHKGSHPLLLLLITPFGSLIHSIISSSEVSVVLVNSFFGASAVFLSSIFFWRLAQKRVEMALLTIVFGLSMTQLVFGSLPETYALAACSIISTYILFLISLQDQKIYFGYWIIAGLFTFSVTITNFVQTLICLSTVVFRSHIKAKIVSILEYIGVIVSFAFLLSILQKVIFPQAKFFFLPTMVTYETKAVSALVLEHPLVVVEEIIKNFFLVNFIAPFPGIESNPQNPNGLILDFFMHPLNYNLVGAVGAALWLCLFTYGFYKNIRSRRRTFFNAVLCAVSFNIALHSIFGVNEIFLYTCNFSFPVLLLSLNESVFKMSYFRGILILIIVAMAVNNFTVLKQMISL